MAIEMHGIRPKIKNCYHFYGCFSTYARRRDTIFWQRVAKRLELFLQGRDVERGWKIYDVSLGSMSAGFVVEVTACPVYIKERLFYYALVYLRKEFPVLSTFDDEAFWSSIVCIRINSLNHFVNTLNQNSRWKNSRDIYEVKRPPPKIQTL